MRHLVPGCNGCDRPPGGAMLRSGEPALREAMERGQPLLQRASAEVGAGVCDGPALQVLRDWLLERGLELELEALAGAVYRHRLQQRARRDFACHSERPIEPDDVSRLVLQPGRALLALAHGAV